MSCEIWAVIVTYNPDIPLLDSGLTALAGQVDGGIIIDNGSGNADAVQALAAQHGLSFVALHENIGLAAAQNAGIRHGMDAEARYILLLDQDTILADGTARNLVTLCQSLEERGIRVGAVGNFFRDSHDDCLGSVWRSHGLRLRQTRACAGKSVVAEADFIIASGSLIPVSTLCHAGLMDVGLFIDLVDVEWGLRAKSQGFRHFLHNRNIMTHTIGSGRQKMLWKNITIHSPMRDYYVIRNSILVARRRYIAVAWRIYFIRRVPFFLLGFSLFADQRRLRCSLMLRGLFDGLLGRGGKYSGGVSNA
ncbi:glycosyltransferase family 2 protein [Acetobacter aceti]|uniref:Rhamnosyltransferase n=1 Tax=Acetobacter aceti TaxID=435 RepID=A0A6S6PU98_ACEAC|nr:glycosyltransferase family 2 protein [Acetobacter aceti]BCI68634.1 rhamnosyltransferase [Acetobacter aceti]